MREQSPALALVGSLFALAWLTSVAGAASQAEQFLAEEQGLILQKGRWLLPAEVEFRQRVDSLKPLHLRIIDARVKLEQTITPVLKLNEHALLEIKSIEAKLKLHRAIRTRDLSAAQRRNLDEQIVLQQKRLNALKGEVFDPSLLGEVPLVRARLVDLSNCRNDLAITILYIHDTRPVLAESYQKLASDKRVQRAIAERSEGERLGPVEEYDSERFLRRLTAFEELVFSDELPIYKDNGRVRVSGIVNRTPLTFTWKTNTEPTFVTASMLEATGLTVPKDAPKSTLRLEDGRDVVVRQIHIPYLRFGRHVLRDVTAYALPAEAENIGAQIGADAFPDVHVEIKPEQLKMVIGAR